MEITSIRLGRATNSSSSHSIVLHAMNDDRVHAQLPADSLSRTMGSYGRNNFILRDAHDKAVLFLWASGIKAASNHEAIEVHSMLRRLGLEDAIEAAKSFEPDMEMSTPYGISVPKGLDMTLAEWFEFLLSDAVTYVAYDDNSETAHATLERDGVVVDLDHVSHWKRDGAALVGYSAHTGTKFRASPAPYEKSTTPELVDVKITDFCGYGCKFCYQGSTTEGMHAPLERIEAIFDELAAMGTFEIAIGGGEPAHHPDFAQILRAGAERGLSVNFTAYGLDWTKNAEVLDVLKKSNGIGIGISVHGAKDITKVERAKTALREKGVYQADIIAQTVVGATPPATIQKLVDTCGEAQIPLLLLGYKETGRGADYNRRSIKRETVKEILQSAKEWTQKTDKYGYATNFHLSVDTAFLDLWGDVLDELGIPTTLRTSPEGKFSCYVDAVEDTVGPSSYAGPEAMAPRGNIKEQFAAW